MKIVIWISCIFVTSIIVVLINRAGILLGGIPTVLLYGLMFVIARGLCRNVDIRRETKKHKDARELQRNIEGTIVCSKCGERQNMNRTVCISCGERLRK